MMTDTDLKYPIGKFEAPTRVDDALRATLISQIADAPGALRRAVQGLSDLQLDTPYREGGWTVRQVVHHLPDSHLNGYVRFKLAITEDEPTIRPYLEARWAELPEARTGDVALSLDLLEALHRRWVTVLRAMPGEAFDRTYRHPQTGLVPLWRALALYAWHGRHHVAHITALAARAGWR
jgi:uncharacterized damage-inducible protein DinB